MSAINTSDGVANPSSKVNAYLASRLKSLCTPVLNKWFNPET